LVIYGDYIESRPGNFVDVNGTVIGKFECIAQYTIGQNAKIPSMDRKWYVAKKDTSRNEILVVSSLNDSIFYYSSATVLVHWISDLPPAISDSFQVKYRYRMEYGMF
jgi:tRNA-specific 2-thiouridylase